MVLEGESDTTPEMLLTVIPELQNGSVISVVRSHNHSGALTSGRLLICGGYPEGAMGLGDPGELPVGSSRGYVREEQRVRIQKCVYPRDVTVPTEVKFDHGLAAKGRV